MASGFALLSVGDVTVGGTCAALDMFEKWCSNKDNW